MLQIFLQDSSKKRLSISQKQEQRELKMSTGSGGDRCHSGGYILRIMPPSWYPVSARVRHGHLQAGHSSLCNDGAAAIPKSGLEIKNRSSSKPVLQAKPFFYAATKIRIGRGRSLQPRPLQAKPFLFAATKIRIGSNKRQIFECFQG